MSPEMHGPHWYDQQTDVFSAGIILHQMLTGVHPYFEPGKDNSETAREKILQNDLWSSTTSDQSKWQGVSPLAKRLTQNFLHSDPKKRLSSRQALDHPWFCSAKKITTPLRSEVLQGILKFESYNKVKQAALRLLAKEVDDPDRIADLRRQFEQLDADADGMLSFEDLVRACDVCQLDISRRELRHVMYALSNPNLGGCWGDGEPEKVLRGAGVDGSQQPKTGGMIRINYRDFLACMVEQWATQDLARLHEIFKKFAETPNESKNSRKERSGAGTKTTTNETDGRTPAFITFRSLKRILCSQQRKEGRKSVRRASMTEQDLRQICAAGGLELEDLESARIDFNDFVKIIRYRPGEAVLA